jgi:hypothetical protein
MLQKYKKIIIVVVVVVLLFVVYSMFFKKTAEPVLSTTPTSGQNLSAENSELITLLSQLKTINLNKTIFSDAIFLSLFDFSVTLIPEPVSRPNPFAPVGNEGVPVIQNQDQVNIPAAF